MYYVSTHDELNQYSVVTKLRGNLLAESILLDILPKLLDKKIFPAELGGVVLPLSAHQAGPQDDRRPP
jgi:hypothetical protein